ncbi:SulP family inorganic anion transporter [Corynebacterium mendelii]|uniref:SulP family inorganic anion transporter n=1 Tax=Corynebacterium mendelii TaxID=2765362 RepID=A0A939E2R9_9CORY|nr:SulP family inorganic anion transporter [Corynebacterium mendelii]MBN9644626.1 SulP family inorganic anion transporter [Corynebacterium mendelii]
MHSPTATRPSPTTPPTGIAASFRAAFATPARLRTEILAGLVVALALIPEAISFSVLAGVDPAVGLYSSFIMAVVISVTGGRPAMITAATGAVALVVAPLVKEHGLDYLVACVLLAGIFQLILSAVGVAKLMRFIPRSVMVGFVNALAILIFGAQLPHLFGVPWLVYPMVALSVAVIVFLPKFTTAIPAPLVAIVIVTTITLVLGKPVPDVAGQGDLPDSLPGLFIPHVPVTLETFTTIAPYALAMALVGLMESLMTAKLVDDITDTHSDKTREAAGQGIANIASAFVGGMGGCAMIGQTMINVKASRARTRLSTLLAGVFLLIAVVALGPVVGAIPMAALVGIMVMVSVATFDWHSVTPATLKLMPASETAVMLATVAATLATHNLAVGVITGVVAASIAFARRVAHLAEVELTDTTTGPDGTVSAVYTVNGQLFFASSNDLVYQFDYDAGFDRVTIDLAQAEVWDASTVASLDAITRKFREKNTGVSITGLTGPSADRWEKLSGRLGEH